MNYTFTFRPLPRWPYPETHDRRSRITFKAAWSDTLALVRYEIERLDGRDVVIGAAFREEDIRLDGMPRSGAREPWHPGIEISFDSPHGRLVYATDVCAFWQHNVRSIGLGLEALRAVDRYGITRRGEQYAGFLKLETSQASPERGRELVEEAGGIKQALMRHHPDQGGDPRRFADVQAYRQLHGGAS